MKPPKAIPRISEKRRSRLGKGPIFSTISSPKKAIRKKPRKKSETLRIYGPPGYVEWIHKRACVACFIFGFSEVAHIQTGGTGRKDDWVRTVPLCGPHFESDMTVTGCHRHLHGIGRCEFEKTFGVDLNDEATETHAAWLAHNLEEM